jgi:hypothetical protein
MAAATGRPQVVLTAFNIPVGSTITISGWINRDGGGVVGEFKFQVADAIPGCELPSTTHLDDLSVRVCDITAELGRTRIWDPVATS